MGIESGHGIEVRVAAMFPRRPKVSAPTDTLIEVKFNYSLFEAKEMGEQVGLPVFAGAPLASSLFDLNATTECGWFDLHRIPSPDEDVFCRIDLSTSPSTFYPDSEISPLSEEELLDRAMLDSELRTWQDWSGIIRKFKNHFNRIGGHFIFGGQYKPMYLVMISGA